VSALLGWNAATSVLRLTKLRVLIMGRELSGLRADGFAATVWTGLLQGISTTLRAFPN